MGNTISDLIKISKATRVFLLFQHFSYMAITNGEAAIRACNIHSINSKENDVKP